MDLILQTLIGFIVLAAMLYAVMMFNHFNRISKQCDRFFANIDVALKKRHDELIKLFSLTRAWLQYEQGLFKSTSLLRDRYRNQRVIDAKVALNNRFNEAARPLVARLEAHPELTGKGQIRLVLTRIKQLDSEIADQRQLFNEAVSNYNVLVNQFPQCLIALIFRFGDRQLLDSKI